MRVCWRHAIAVLLVSVSMPGVSAFAEDTSIPVEVASTDGVTAFLKDNRIVVAAGIDPMQGTPFEKRLAGAFRKSLTNDVFVEPTGSRTDPDRHGRIPALILTRGEPVQLWLLRSGLTRFTGFQTGVKPETLRQFREAEREARLEKKGLWNDPWHSVFTPDTVPLRHGFAVVEGTPLEVAHTRSMIYLNFGDDWRNDFTVGIAPRILKTNRWSGWDVDSLTGKRLRVRGWMRAYNGAFMTVTSPDQIEVLTP